MDESILDRLSLCGVVFPGEAEGGDGGSTVEYVAKDARFVLRDSGFESQFAPTYFCRFSILKPFLLSRARSIWPTTEFARVVEIKSEEVVVSGILFKSMKLKPQALDKYLSKRVAEIELQKNKNRVRDDDVIFLEDEGSRVQLAGEALQIRKLVSGICVAVKGYQLPDGRFDVSDICYPGLADQVPLTVRSEENYLVLISGLNLKSADRQSRLALDLLSQYIGGSMTGLAERIVHVVICGGLIGENEELATAPPNSRPQLRALEPIIELDRLLSQIAEFVAVDVMPGPHDPSTLLMPQQPIHKCLFPTSSRLEKLNRVSNPHDFELDGVRICGTSGQNVDDIMLHADYEDRIETMEQCLQWRHLAPTCPDTLPCFPFSEDDPFIISETPHIFFSGNQPKFDTKLINSRALVESHFYPDAVGDDKTIRLVCVPDFHQTHLAVLINLGNLDCHEISFETAFTQ